MKKVIWKNYVLEIEVNDLKLKILEFSKYWLNERRL